ncbi:MAG: peptidylprolyl isomerase [Alphaproteobacteria bacterium]
MKSIAPGIVVNNIRITPEQIGAEMQYHPAESVFSAKYDTMQSLVVQELLIQRAVELGLCARDEAVKNPDAVFEELFEKEISVPDPDRKTCENFYNNNKKKFFTSPLFEAAHILYLAPAKDDEMRQEALKKAEKTLKKVQKSPDVFEKLARSESACSSAKTDGHLGQITKGQTSPAFEVGLFAMQEGEISKEPLASEYGYHILKVYKRIEGKQLPFEAVHEWIIDYLMRQSWQRAFSQYVQLLAGEAKISGFQLKRADSPLVQ